MPNMRHHFAALLGAINPGPDRLALAARLPGEVREWLKEHEFETSYPHSRLSGSYARETAILKIKDIDVLLFVPESQLERTPNAVLLELKKVLDEYPDATAEASGQRRSVHLEFPGFDVHLDIVPTVMPDGLDSALKVPDRPGCEWIDSDPLGYARRLSALNQEHGGHVVPLIKLLKAWRNVQMKVRKPKSYVLEVLVLYAVENGDLTLRDRPVAEHVAGFFSHILCEYGELWRNGSEAPRLRDPQISSSFITRGWDRAHFETFMRRIDESSKLAEKALQADAVEAASESWGKVFGELWPGEEAVKETVRLEAKQFQPGIAVVTSSGRVLPPGSPGVQSRETKYHGV